MKLSTSHTEASVLKIVGWTPDITRAQLSRMKRQAAGMAAGTPGASKAAKMLKRQMPP